MKSCSEIRGNSQRRGSLNSQTPQSKTKLTTSDVIETGARQGIIKGTQTQGRHKGLVHRGPLTHAAIKRHTQTTKQV